MPQREHRPYVGLIPTVPVKAAGCRMEPPVSVAVAPRHKRAATAAEDPPDEPPGTSKPFLSPFRAVANRALSQFGGAHGDTTGPMAEVSLDEPMANSSLLSLPNITAPSRHNWLVTVDS